jgi:hypothetical protein
MEGAVQVSGWVGFLRWAFVGALYGVTYLGMMSIGILILPIAIIATIVTARRVRVWPEILGIVFAPAVVMVRLALGSWGIRSCEAGEQSHMTVSASGSGSAASGTYVETMHFDGCTSMNVELLFYGGIAVVVAALAVYLAARYRLARHA